MRQPLCLAAAALGLLLIHAAAAHAQVTGVIFDPPIPTSHDPIRITIRGQGVSCGGGVEATVAADVIHLVVLACPASPSPGVAPFAKTAVVGPLPVGFYTVNVDDQFTLRLEVNDTAPPPPTIVRFFGDRFEAAVAWHTPTAAGVGRPEALTEGSASFWFFDPSSAELMVKVLDGRGVNGHFWVFVGGLSNVAYTLTVTDRNTGAVRTYANTPGTLASRADTAAF